MSFIARHRWLTLTGVVFSVLVLAVALFQWDWLIPLVDRRASTALGRPVTIQHLHVSLGRTTRIEADGLVIANPDGWPGGGNSATAERLGIDLVPMDYIRHRQLTIPVVDLQAPKVEAHQLADGTANWTFPFMKADPSQPASTSPGPKLGTLRITDGTVHVRVEKLKADFNIDVKTQDSADGTGQIAATAKGTYANQPITAQLVSGALLSIRDAAKPYPVDLKFANGATHVALLGSVQDPLAFAGANLKLELSGPDMSLLLPLTGIAIPKTPPYRIAGQLDYSDGVVKFHGATGKVGSSDLAGDIDVDTKPQRPVVTATLQSKLVDLKDLGGFIGANPGDAEKGTKAGAAPSNGKVLPNDPINLPKLTAADVFLKYHASRIQGRRQPLDNMQANLDVVNGEVTLKPLSFSVGQGTLSALIALSEKAGGVHARADIDFHRLDVDKLLTATGLAHGAGTISGKAVIDGSGRSLADILGHGNGEVKLFMGAGGDLSALIVDLSGLQFGNAFLSAIGIPNRAKLQCLVMDMPLQQGVLSAKTIMIDTDEGRIGITGTISLRTESLGLQVKTEAKHFSVGSLPTPINVTGPFASPGIMPEVGPLALRGGAAIALGIIGTPLAALLPTIQFGIGDDNACSGLLRQVQTPPKLQPTAPARAPTRR